MELQVIRPRDEDIREKAIIGPEDVRGLNFMRYPSKFVFRRHYRTGLRSHILEVLPPEQVKREREGVIRDGIRTFPKAKPFKVLRLFRTKFTNLEEALDEIGTVKVVERYLAPLYMAMSEEFLVSYRVGERFHIMLCGLQVYVPGKILNPWTTVQEDPLSFAIESFVSSKEIGAENYSKLLEQARSHLEQFVERVKSMIREAGHIPDLAGIGNLILTEGGRVCLVDINNISQVSFGPEIPLDDRGYPVCDKSIEALAMLEHRWLGRESYASDPLYGKFLTPSRMAKVRELERAFHQKGWFLSRSSPDRAD